MTVPTPSSTCASQRRETLVNWLALLVLLALGIVWPGNELAPRAAPSPPVCRLN